MVFQLSGGFVRISNYRTILGNHRDAHPKLVREGSTNRVERARLILPWQLPGDNKRLLFHLFADGGHVEIPQQISGIEKKPHR